MQTKPNRKRGILEIASDALDLPSHSIANLPLLHLTGDKEIRVENHKGILAYSNEEIHISGGSLLLKIQGEDLNLRVMTGVELLITGRIHGITVD